MFLPSENVYYELLASYQELWENAAKKKIWICSPTTLMAVLFTIDNYNNELRTHRNLKQIVTKIHAFEKVFDRWYKNWDDFYRNITEKLPETARKLDGYAEKVIVKGNEVKSTSEKYGLEDKFYEPENHNFLSETYSSLEKEGER
jgi:DNA recombination protein RmuC